MRFGPNQLNHLEFVPLHGEDWHAKQSHAGRAVSLCLSTSKNLIEENPGISLEDLESECLKILSEFDCTPTFKGYQGFPSAICTSVNKNLVHGVVTDDKIKEGDVVSVDLGATYDGAIADAAITAICGKPKDLRHEVMIKKCQEALHVGIEAIEVGKPLGVIGAAIFGHVKKSGFKLITHYGGHGITWNTPHCQPFVHNKASKDDGVIIQSGMAIAIEPMLVMGNSDKTKTLNDGWTVVAKDISCHAEHSVFIKEDGGVDVITAWEWPELQRKENRVNSR